MTTSNILREGNGVGAVFLFDVFRSGDISQVSIVNWSVTGSGASAVSASDFYGYGGLLPAGSLTFAAGETAKIIALNVNGDDNVWGEDDETFIITLSNPSVGTSITMPTATGTILNDDAFVWVNGAIASAYEGNSGAMPFTFTVTRSGFLNQASSVSWAVVGSGANAADAADFVGGVLPSGTVNFAAGESTKTITVNVAGDISVEALSETFSVCLSAPSLGTTIDASSASIGATGTILNDDGTPQLSISAPSLVEGSYTVYDGRIKNDIKLYTFTVNRSVNLSGASSATWTVVGTGANPTDASDFSGPLTGTVSFAQGESSKQVTIAVRSDKVYEADETFAVTLSNPSNAAIGTASVTATIVNDDTNWAISTTDIAKAEGNSGVTTYTYTVTRLGPALPGTVNWAVSRSGTNPADATDFSQGKLPTGSLTFAAAESSKTFTVDVKGDSFNESNETFSVALIMGREAIPVYRKRPSPPYRQSCY
jgi:hypothetical protein